MKNESISRRRFLGQAAAAGLGIWALGSGAFSGCAADRAAHISGQLLGPDFQSGHQLRTPMGNLQPKTTRKVDLLIVGGGVAGLACAWQLRQRGFHDFLLLEMEDRCGGNARGGSQNGLKHPWGAHYLPVPDARNIPLMQFLQQNDVVTGFDFANRPIFNELYLCHSPQERLQIHGVWQPSLIPNVGVPASEAAQIKRFFELMEAWKHRLGNDGKPAFNIPAATSSRDPEILALDGITMESYLRSQSLDSPHLDWYINYCCRDDFGTDMRECSAWAGIQYFAARNGGGANAESGAVLTWPEGNAWLTDRLRGDMEVGKQWLGRHMVAQLRNTAQGVEALALDLEAAGEALQIQAKTAVFAGPQYVAKHIIADFAKDLGGMEYAPWMVANLRLKSAGNALLQGLCWDNVPYGRDSLGYVDAGHQLLQGHEAAERVLTWYQPITAAGGRKALLASDYGSLQAQVLEDMEFMHHGISAHIAQLDIWRWGHGMVRPVPGLLTGERLAAAGQAQGKIHFAHSDLSGISIFEEAFAQGIRAADAALNDLA